MQQKEQGVREENAAKAALRAGFTLVELLVVVAILGVLGTIAIQNVTEHIRKANITAAETSCRSIKEAVATYYMSKKKLPTSLTQLIEGTDDNPPILEGGEGVLIDPWDNEYKYEVRGKRYTILSAGPDGDFGTEDDISSDKINRSNK
ncbi:MAG: type II secretion system protein GspG [Kiritimatiellae bacterium]|nr:type II secretion system protein GspG [Kiritimatiellia bacterium]